MCEGPVDEYNITQSPLNGEQTEMGNARKMRTSSWSDLDLLGSDCDDSLNEEVKEEDLNSEPTATLKTPRLKKQNSWGEIDLDVDDEQGEEKAERSHRRRRSWDYLDLSDRLRLTGTPDSQNHVTSAFSASFSYGPTSGNIVLVGKLDDNDSPLTLARQEKLSVAEEEAQAKSALKGLSNRLGLMSPFKAKKKAVAAGAKPKILV